VQPAVLDGPVHQAVTRAVERHDVPSQMLPARFPHEVEAWLIASGFAERRDGELVATAKGRAIAGAAFGSGV
jgi:hypothetical protein